MANRGLNVRPPVLALSTAASNMANGHHSTIDLDAPSVWLYLGGLVVTLTALYAVNFGLHDPAYVVVTYALACTGYLLSYGMRVHKVSVRAFRTPALVVLALTAVVALSSDQMSGGLVPTALRGTGLY